MRGRKDRISEERIVENIENEKKRRRRNNEH
jgi:hypothetical protein